MASHLVPWLGGAVALALADIVRRREAVARSTSVARCEGCPFGGSPAVTGGPRLPKVVASPVEGRDFAVFRRQGATAKEVKFQELLEDLCESSRGAPHAVLLGEVHDDPVTHLLQLAVLKHLGQRCREEDRRLVLSLEMFEMDVQNVLDEYVLHQVIREEDMLMDTRPWGNYLTDYRPMVQFCRDKGIRVIAANAPRRYVSLVSRQGTGILDDLQAKVSGTKLPLPPFPLPPPSAAYRRKFEETMSMPALQTKTGSCPFIGFSSEDLRSVRPETMQAQLLWDHAMAKSVASALEDDQVPLVLHLCGAFHCAHGLGIPEALPRYWSTSASKVNEDEVVGPKACPEGVTCVVCWPASVSATLEQVRSGHVPRALGAMGDWVIITEETFAEQVAS